MSGRELADWELELHRPGEAVTLTSVMAVLVIAVVAIVVYKLLKSSAGGVKIPGGWTFSWR